MVLRTNGLAAVALVALVVLAGCSGAGVGGGGGDGAPQDASLDGGAPEESGGAPEATGVPEASGDGDGGDGGGSAKAATTGEFESASDLATKRAIIRTATMTVEVESHDEAAASLRELVAEQGGFVAGAEQTVHREGNRTWTTGTLVLRVPSGNYSAVVAGAKSVGTVQSADSDTRDVTDQLVDLNARIENLKVQRDRLRGLYESANDTEDVLAVSDRLSEVQGEIERLEARRRSLREQVALSTVTVRLKEPRPERTPTPTPTPEPAFHETGLASAFLASVNGVWVTLRTTAVALAYALPYLLAFGLPVVGVGAAVYRFRER